MNTETTLSPAEFATQLAHYDGTDYLRRYDLPLTKPMAYTNGVQFFIDNCGGGAYWFLDIVATSINDLNEEFVVVNLIVEDGKALITADDGNDNLLWKRKIDYTDAFDGEWKFYLIKSDSPITTGGAYSTFLLPREY